MWFIGVEVEQETSAPPPKKNPGSAPVKDLVLFVEHSQQCFYRTNSRNKNHFSKLP